MLNSVARINESVKLNIPEIETKTQPTSPKTPHVKPDEKEALAHLEYLFGGLEDHPLYGDGRVEIGWHVDGGQAARFYRLTELHKAARNACSLTEQGFKIYVHMGLISADSEKVRQYEETDRAGHSKGEDVLCWTSVFGEADTGHLKAAAHLTGDERNAERVRLFMDAGARIGIPWGFVQTTGTVPTTRLHGFTRLAEPVAPDDMRFARLLKSLSHGGDLDTAANNSSQVMRLCGTLSHASKKKSEAAAGEAARVTEKVTCIHNEAAIYDLQNDYEAVTEMIFGDRLYSGEIKKSTTGSAASIDALRAQIKVPEGATPMDRGQVREWARGHLAYLATLTVARRPAALNIARLIGGVLWTGAIYIEELLADIDKDDDGGDMSIIAAFRASGADKDNGFNGFDKGVLDLLAAGARAPLKSLDRYEDVFGDVSGEEGDDDDEPKSADDNTPNSAADTAAKRSWFLSGDAVANWTPTKWTVKGLLPDTGICLLWGESHVYKSWLMVDWANRMDRGMPIAGIASKAVGVCFLAGEGNKGLSGRFRAWETANELGAGRVLMTDESLDLFGDGTERTKPQRVAAKKRLKTMLAEYEEHCGKAIRVVMIDTLSSVSPMLDETDSTSVKCAFDVMRKLERELNLLFILVHHSGKTVANGARGSYVFFSNSDTQIAVGRDLKDAKGKKLLSGLGFDVSKQRDGAARPAAQPFTVRDDIVIGDGEDGAPETSVIIVYKQDLALADARMAVSDGDDARELGSGPDVGGVMAAPAEPAVIVPEAVDFMLEVIAAQGDWLSLATFHPIYNEAAKAKERALKKLGVEKKLTRALRALQDMISDLTAANILVHNGRQTTLARFGLKSRVGDQLPWLRATMAAGNA